MIRFKYFVVLFKWIFCLCILIFLLCELFSEYWGKPGGNQLSSKFEWNLQQSIRRHRFDYDCWWRYHIHIGKRVQLLRFITGTISCKIIMLNLIFAINRESVCRIVYVVDVCQHFCYLCFSLLLIFLFYLFDNIVDKFPTKFWGCPKKKKSLTYRDKTLMPWKTAKKLKTFKLKKKN